MQVLTYSNLQTRLRQQPAFGISVFDDLRPHPATLLSLASVVLVALLDEFVDNTLNLSCTYSQLRGNSSYRVEEKVNTVTATPGHPEILLEAKWRATLRQSLSPGSPPWADFNSE